MRAYRINDNRFLGLFLLAVILSALLSGCETLAAQFRSPVERLHLEADRLVSENRQAEALLTYRQVVDMEPKNVAVLLKLGQLYAEQGRLRLAYRYLFKAQVAQPQDENIKVTLAALPTPIPSNSPLKLLWRVELCEGEPVGFAIQSGALIAVMDTGKIISLNLADGEVNWMIDLPSKATSAPFVTESHIWVGSQDGALYTLALSNGDLEWKFVSGAPIYAAPILDNGLLYVASSDGNLYALDVKDGTARWKIAIGSALHAQPVISNGVVFFGSNNARLYAVNALTGEDVWKNGILTQGAVESSVIVSKGRVYFGSGDSRLYCLAEATGGEYWRVSMGDAVYARPVIVGEVVFASSSGKALVAVETISGKKIWEVRTANSITTSPLVDRDVVYYVASGDPYLYAVNRLTGQILWQIDTGDWLVGPPQMSNGVIYLAGKDGSIQAYK